VQIDQQAMMSATLPGPGGKASGTIEVQFPHGYHAGATLQVSITASSAGSAVAAGNASTTLAAGCSNLTVPVNAGGVDGGTDDLSMPADMLMLPVPQVTAKPDLVGFTTSLDSAGTSDPLGQTLTLTWAMQQAPAGSGITTASLTSTSAAKTTFDPDRGGVYKIALTATAADGRSATLVTDVDVPTVPVFYGRMGVTATTFSMAPHLVGSDGAGDREVGCPFSADGGADTTQIMPFYGRAFDPPAGGIPKFVFLELVDTSGTPPHLVVATPSTDCAASKPVRVDDNQFTDHFPVTARFSPDGTRIVYVDTPQSSDGTNRLVTVSADGTGPKHVVRSSGYFGLTPAIWLDNSTVAWIEADSNSANPFTIWKAPDANAAGDPANNMRTQMLRCDQSMNAAHLAQINQFEVSPFGLIVAGSTSARCALCTRPEAAVTLYKLAPNDCSTTAAQTLISEPVGELSWDFSLSPDGLKILFSSTHGGVIPDGGAPEPQADIYFVPADGSAAAVKVAGDPLYDDIAPRWIAGGRQFLWTQAPRLLDMGADTPAIFFANFDGSHVRSFTPAATAGERVIRSDTGVNRGFDCSGVPGAVATGAPLALLLLGLVLSLAISRSRGRS